MVNYLLYVAAMILPLAGAFVTSGRSLASRASSFSTLTPLTNTRATFFPTELTTNFFNFFGGGPKKLPEKAELISLIEDLEAAGGARGSSSATQSIRLNELIEILALNNPNPQCVQTKEGRRKLEGSWRLAYTARENQGLESAEWLQYLIKNGPSPVQRFVLGSVYEVARIYQTLELDENGGRFKNIIDFRDALGGVLNLEAAVDGYTGGTQLDIRFDNAFFLFEKNPFTGVPFSEPKRIPYPVPFKLLPNEARGLLDNIYVDGDFRLARGNKGTVFVLRRANLGE
jgi:hypothetical protein